MKVGLDTFTLHEMKPGPFEALEFCEEHGLAGAQFGGVRGMSPGLDVSRLKDVRARADRLGLYTHVSVSTCNPFKIEHSAEAHVENLAEEVRAAAECGWHELHSTLGALEERYGDPVPFAEQLEGAEYLLERLGPVLRDCASRINLETHGDATTFELVRLAEEVGPDVVGICLDTANVLCQAEDPVSAAERAAPYTHLTHTKDAIIYFTDEGYQRQTRPAGEGALDWEGILPILARHSPDLPLSIEDHKWLFDFPIFDPEWHEFHPDLTSAELGQVVGIAWRCQKRIMEGELMDPQEYESIPFSEQLVERIHSGRDYLRDTLARLGLGT